MTPYPQRIDSWNSQFIGIYALSEWQSFNLSYRRPLRDGCIGGCKAYRYHRRCELDAVWVHRDDHGGLILWRLFICGVVPGLVG